MSEMIDRVKAAMRATHCDCEQWDDGPITEIARAAVEAMREPTDEMTAAGSAASDPQTFADPAEIWDAMITAALSTPQTKGEREP